MATEPSRSSSADGFSVAELSVRAAEGDLLLVDPLGFGPGLAARMLSGLRLLAIDPIVPAAAQIGGTTLRSLDAIRLATAFSSSGELGR
jgi:hypothetical protein